MTVVLLSGGLDSAVCLALNPGAKALKIDYGQPHAAMEGEAAAALCRHYGVPLHFANFYLPYGLRTFDEYDPAMVVPGRNLILLSIAATFRLPVVIGCNADDHEVYEDCRLDFLLSAGEPLGVPVYAPLIEMTKPQIGTLARQLDVPVQLTWSCYYPTQDHEECGRCDACMGRERALA